MSIKFGCQGSTWMLDYDVEADMMDKMMNDVQNGGFQGLDVQVSLLGRYHDEPERLRYELETRDLQLAALTLPTAFEGGHESETERKRTDYYIDYLKHFPGAILNVPSRVGPSRDDLSRRQSEIINGANELGKRAYDKGIIASIHPISYKTSYWRTADDYKILLEGLDSRYMGYTPDVGHITFGDMDAAEIFKEYFQLIRHVHFKDASISHEWRKMGEGDIDFEGCVEVLVNRGYGGWIMVEEETPEAQLKTTETIAELGKYVEQNLVPIVRGNA
ncbi:sugar phosphate isomerase/epimerase [Alicyclobacillus sp. SO9]|uniref:sugar phosphate isomerase/epimerase family protein n=1 Tax=Alicyclobacillus sp. SO9 TaxID=2665646 RepID=UPI0018E8EE1F|nr:sugar phosphate isomerase/epimerase family protein [Alicyclobacillus sp. SO9]QQE80631.1 sugar phosphate isomerase/epimerase [Alicyclobacillus sp. SO9]